MPGADCTAEYKLTAKDTKNNYSGFSETVEIDFSSNMWKTGGHQVRKPTTFAFHPAYPNPFNPSTQIKFDLPEASHVTLAVYDVLGRKVAELVNGQATEGYHTATWNTVDAASGVYFARFTATDGNGAMKFSRISKLVLSR
ncbi:MAG: T9SS type A sorting domain-containing protein [Ignavibacteriae bacterium]|nr:T9SS type A sorting domain-containing protein [Ignavibacteriota bacterium]